MRERLGALPFVVRDNAAGAIVGQHALLQRRGGATGGSRSATPGTRSACSARAVNTECKLLLLAHAFETLRCIAVEFRTHFFNFSRARGDRPAGREAGRRPAQPPARCPTATLRDTVVFSIIAGEWPAVKRHLDLRARRVARRPEAHVLIGFFLHLKAARLPVSTREFLTLLEALEARVVVACRSTTSTPRACLR